HGNLDAVRLLLDKGALVDAKNRQGFTALKYATRDGRKEIAELLKARGAKE
ncbi:MAG: ankyrin repeat domain-containing protein, partial [Deltaproteobacteria bacterium]|nr:ankyrin repeat domain-containing protein [Deltaproteobacteria bacterium]